MLSVVLEIENCISGVHREVRSELLGELTESTVRSQSLSIYEQPIPSLTHTALGNGIGTDMRVTEANH